MTDGVANIYKDGSLPQYGPGCGADVASCNVGYTDSNPPRAKPITAMALEADSLKQLATIYVIAMAGVDETGLKDVASAPNYPFFSSAKNGTDLQGIFDSIETNVKEGQCVPTAGNSWKKTIGQEGSADIPPPSGPLAYPTVGYVYLYDQSGNVLPNGKAPIQVEAQSGNLTYHFDNMAPGIYQMKAFVGYKGSDGVSRSYSMIFNPYTQTADDVKTFQLKPSDSLGSVVPMEMLYLDLKGTVCPNP
jgi:hypothetical protein